MTFIRPLMASFSPIVFLSFTKLRFWWSFWGTERVKILIGSKVMASDVTWGWVQVRQTPKIITTDRWPCAYHTWPFFANCIFIFQKTEIQTVILRCLTSLNLNWYKSYDTKCRNVKNTNVLFCTKSQKNGNGKDLHFVS